MVFIDGSNLYHVLSQTCGRHDLRFGKFVEKLTSGRDLVRAYYYNVRQDRTHNAAAAQEQERFLASLEEVPYLETRLGIYKQRGVEMVEKGVDVMIATDLVSGAFKNLYDTAILVSGDGDFFPAIEAVKDLGKHVEVVAFENNLSPEAGRAADVTTMLRPSYFTTLWTSRTRGAAGQAGTGGRQRGAAARDAEETPPMPPVAPAEEEEVVGRLERPEPGVPAERVEEPAAAEKPPQRERRRFGRRRRGGGGAGGAGGGGAASGGSGRGTGGPLDRSQDVTHEVPPPQPETKPQTPQPPPHQRQPVRPPRLRNVGQRSESPAIAGSDGGGSAGDPAPSTGNGNNEARSESQARRRLGWLRRRLTPDFGDSGPGNPSPAPAG
jgi:uncharacterized LabA/DUF88 family protein